jgi:hypothetical protein
MTLMLPPHIAECTRLDSTTNDSPMEDVQVADAAYYFISTARDV